MSEDSSNGTLRRGNRLPPELQLEVSDLLEPKDAAVSEIAGLAVDPKRKKSASWSCARVWGSIFNPELSSEAILEILSRGHHYPVTDLLLIGQDLRYLYHDELYRDERPSRPLYLHLQEVCGGSYRREKGDRSGWMQAFRNGWAKELKESFDIIELMSSNIVLLVGERNGMEDLLSLGIHDTFGLRYKGGNELQNLGLKWQLGLQMDTYQKALGPHWNLEIFPIKPSTFPIYKIEGSSPWCYRFGSEPYNEDIESFAVEVYNNFLDYRRPDDDHALLWRMEDNRLPGSQFYS